MTRNEGLIDRSVRVLAGLALIASPLGFRLRAAQAGGTWRIVSFVRGD